MTRLEIDQAQAILRIADAMERIAGRLSDNTGRIASISESLEAIRGLLAIRLRAEWCKSDPRSPVFPLDKIVNADKWLKSEIDRIATKEAE